MKYSAKKLHSITEVQTSFHWDVTFSGAPFLKYGEDMRMKMTTGTLPKPEAKNLDVTLHGFTFPQPGIVNRNGEIELTAVDMVDAKIALMAMEWYDNVYAAGDGDINGVQKVNHADLFGTVKMQLLNKKEDKVTRTYTLNFALISDFEPGFDLQDGAEEAEYAKPKLKLAYGWANFGVADAKNL